MADEDSTATLEAHDLVEAAKRLAEADGEQWEDAVRELTIALLAWYGEARYDEHLQEHLVRAPAVEGQQPGEGEIYFQSDKYPWCPAEFVPLKLTDPDARAVLAVYASLHEDRDASFSADLEEAIRIEADRDRCEGCSSPATRPGRGCRCGRRRPSGPCLPPGRGPCLAPA